MKKVTLLLLFTAISLTTFSQSPCVLDEKFGFKTIKFDTKPSDYEHIYQTKQAKASGEEFYNYLGSDDTLRKVFDISFPDIGLHFDDDTKLLYEIYNYKYFKKAEYTKEQVVEVYGKLLEKFTEALGSPIEGKEGDNFTHLWVGKKVNLYMLPPASARL